MRLKLFPAASLAIPYLMAVREILPPAVKIWPVGGVGASNMSAWLDAGAEGIGTGSSLYRPGDSASQVSERARHLITAWRQWRAQSK